jgi:two-component system, LytTR family, sensor histidine kinase AlgZ
MSSESVVMRPPIGRIAAIAAHVLADAVAVSLIVAFWLYLATGAVVTPQLWSILGQVWLYAIPIATAAHVMLPPMYPLVSRQRAYVQWAVLAGLLTPISVAGSVAGSVLVLALSLAPAMTFAAILSQSVPVAVFLVLLVGLVHALVCRLQDRLHATSRQLRTQEAAHEQALKLAAEARLAALEARIHPHFLFNTLNTISSLIPTAPARAERLVGQMSALLRFCLETSHSGLVPLQQEMKVVTDYLEIEQARFGARLRFSLDIDDRLSAVRVPPLSVQTLVENCVKHAVVPSRKGAEIRVRAVCDGGRMRIEVADDGPGFAATEVPAGHGLDNLRSRLTLLFGEREPMTVARRNGGTTVSFRVPA